MKWCCSTFAGWYDQAGRRGFAVLIGRDSTNAAEFLMQYRAVDEGEALSFNSEALVSSIVEVGMRFCPWCGRDLEKWYGKHADALHRSHFKVPNS